MKATILTSVFAVLVSVTSVSAKDGKVYSNVECNESEVKKELIVLDSKTSAPLNQNVYIYDVDGNIQEKVVSKWIEDKGWVSTAKYEYTYNEQGKVANLTYTKWDKKSDTWAADSQLFVHVYDESSELIAVNELSVNNANGLISQK